MCPKKSAIFLPKKGDRETFPKNSSVLVSTVFLLKTVLTFLIGVLGTRLSNSQKCTFLFLKFYTFHCSYRFAFPKVTKCILLHNGIIFLLIKFTNNYSVEKYKRWRPLLGQFGQAGLNEVQTAKLCQTLK